MRTVLALKRSSLSLVTVAVAAVLGTLVATPAGAAPYPADSVPGTTPVTVTLSLRPRDPAQLARAAAAGPRMSRAERDAARAAAAPTDAAFRRTVEHLRGHGFTVLSTTGWAVTARGTAAAALSAFGARLHGGTTATGASALAPATRPRIPAALRADVLAVSGLDTQARWQHRALPPGHNGGTLASAYAAGTPDGSGTTVATVQFSGWHASDLTTYARTFGLPVPTPTLVEVGTMDSTNTTSGGTFEVALDQEVVLATAPHAKQVIYFAENDSRAAVQLYNQLAADVTTRGIDAVSISWGMCERVANTVPDDRAAIESALQQIVAAGATVFAASGDFGVFDCGDSTYAVDFPASSPWVVGVGGTKLQGGSETGWSDADGYASGGGYSSSVPRPSWQSALPFSGTTRMVPDVAALADPYPGFATYAQSEGGWVLGGGTSASAPIWAGQLASMLSRAGRTEGLGSIHAALYRTPGSFRDITSGNNFGYSAVAGYDLVTGLGTPKWDRLGPALLGDPAVAAPAAVRTLTVPITVTDPAGTGFTSYVAGEGTGVTCGPGSSPTPPTSVTLAPGADGPRTISVAATSGAGRCHIGRRTVSYDTKAPTVSLSVRPVAADARTVFSWTGRDASPASGVAYYTAAIVMYGGGSMWSTARTTGRSVTLTLRQGWTYVLKVNAVDHAGNRGPTAQYVYAVPVDELGMSRSSGWSRQLYRQTWYGGHHRSAVRGATVSRGLVGRRYDVIFTASAYNGYVDVLVDGRFVKRIDTWSSGTVFRRYVTVATYATAAARTITLRVVGARNPSSRGTYVYVDAVRAVA